MHYTSVVESMWDKHDFPVKSLSSSLSLTSAVAASEKEKAGVPQTVESWGGAQGKAAKIPVERQCATDATQTQSVN